MRIPALICIFLAACNVSSCAFVSGAGAMRIDVEVYKGPLSKEPGLQWAELKGLLKETEHSLREYHEALCAIADTYLTTGSRAKADRDQEFAIGCPYTADAIGKSTWAAQRAPIDWCRHPHLNTQEKELCFNLAQVHEATAELQRETEAMTAAANFELQSWPDDRNDKAKIQRANLILKRIAELSMRLKVKAVNRAFALATFPPTADIAWSRAVRFASTAFANLASEYSNQLGSRADALAKQLDGTDRKALAQSAYLRDSQATDFPNLYIWMRAGGPALVEDRILHPLHAFSSDETADRIRIVERLYADNFWSNVNTVYASGRGDVAMAFIKDDIGNWSLKNFDNQPGELLKAYRDSGRALVVAAADLAKQAATGGAQIEPDRINRVLQAANKFALGGTTSGADASAVQQARPYHMRTEALLKDLKRRATEREAALLKSITDRRQSAISRQDEATPGDAQSACAEDGETKAEGFREQAGKLRERVADGLSGLEVSLAGGASLESLGAARRFADRSDQRWAAAERAGDSEKCIAYVEASAYADAAWAWLEVVRAERGLMEHRLGARNEALRILGDQEIAINALSQAVLSSPRQ